MSFILTDKQIAEQNNKARECMNIDGTKLVAKDVAIILNELPMCDFEIEYNSLLILNHRGEVTRRINF